MTDPLDAGYRYRWKGHMVGVTAPDGTDLGLFSSEVYAHAKAERHYRESRKRVRPCLRCACPFESEGPHNRLCKTCRADSGGMV